ncbi:FAD-dependent oxidoreductase [uncultured Paracoccus sp.]|uniref:FAD-dependent oxidoreductase n=1 Tax=uncultured Paracoccus sp. TaxID=189685 RepID=UPI0026084190|nr:FAD-dependent oxidoreductase [uncultured Paracoccus sp.]
MTLQGRPVTVVGAGIAGLTTALALAQRGADVTVHERAGAFREVGAGIQISPNAGRVLTALGLDREFTSISAPLSGVQLRNGSDGAEVARLDYARHRPDAQFRSVHRARLVDLLEHAARTAGVSVHLGTEIDNLPTVPLLIGADGLHSRVRTALNGPQRAFFTGHVAWRALIPLEPDAAHRAQVFMAPGRHLVSYPLAHGLRNIVAVEERADWTAEDWVQTDDPDNLRRAFRGFGGPVPGWLARVEQCGLWGLFRHQVAETWQDGARVILGDAAHPTLPFLAQGACMAIEDAWVLAACLAAGPDQSAALVRYQALRRPRAARIVAAANDNARNYHLGGARRGVAHTALRLASAAAPRLLFDRYAWVFDHDPTAISSARIADG